MLMRHDSISGLGLQALAAVFGMLVIWISNPLMAVAADDRTRAINLTVTLAAEIPKKGVIGTRRAEQARLQVQDGRTLNLSRASGRDYQLQAGGAFVWAQVQQVPAQAESVVITPTRVADNQASVDVAVSLKQNSRLVDFQSTLLTKRGEWVQLFGPAPADDRDGTVYSTGSQKEEQLFMKVDW